MRDAWPNFCPGVVLRNYWNIKTRLFVPYGVANPRDRQCYYCGLFFVWPKNLLFLFVLLIAKHYTSRFESTAKKRTDTLRVRRRP